MPEPKQPPCPDCGSTDIAYNYSPWVCLECGLIFDEQDIEEMKLKKAV